MTLALAHNRNYCFSAREEHEHEHEKEGKINMGGFSFAK
jgi:hypothetical protein